MKGKTGVSKGISRKQRRARKYKTPWRDGVMKGYTENKTKKVLTEKQRKQKRKQSRGKRV